MPKSNGGILTFSDGRKYIHEDLLETNQRYQKALEDPLSATGGILDFRGREIIWNHRTAQAEGLRLAEAGCVLTILNYAIWYSPDLSEMFRRQGQVNRMKGEWPPICWTMPKPVDPDERNRTDEMSDNLRDYVDMYHAECPG